MKRRQSRAIKKVVVNTPRQRNARWLYEEEKILVDCVEKYYDVLFGGGSNRVSEESKNNLWEDIRIKLQECNSDTTREISAIKVKWIDLKSRTKKKIENMLLNGELFGDEELEEFTLEFIEETLAKLVSSTELKIVQMIGISQLIKNVTEREGDQSPIVGKEYVPSAPSSKPHVNSNNENVTLAAVGKELVNEIRGVKMQLLQFNETFQEYVKLKKLKLGLDPNESISNAAIFITATQSNSEENENQEKNPVECNMQK